MYGDERADLRVLARSQLGQALDRRLRILRVTQRRVEIVGALGLSGRLFARDPGVEAATRLKPGGGDGDVDRSILGRSLDLRGRIRRIVVVGGDRQLLAIAARRRVR